MAAAGAALRSMGAACTPTGNTFASTGSASILKEASGGHGGQHRQARAPTVPTKARRKMLPRWRESDEDEATATCRATERATTEDRAQDAATAQDRTQDADTAEDMAKSTPTARPKPSDSRDRRPGMLQGGWWHGCDTHLSQSHFFWVLVEEEMHVSLFHDVMAEAP